MRMFEPVANRLNYCHNTLERRWLNPNQVGSWEPSKQHCRKTRHLEHKSSHNRNSLVTRHKILLHNCSRWLKCSRKLTTSLLRQPQEVEWSGILQVHTEGCCTINLCNLIKPSPCPSPAFGLHYTSQHAEQQKTSRLNAIKHRGWVIPVTEWKNQQPSIL